MREKIIVAKEKIELKAKIKFLLNLNERNRNGEF